MTNFTPLDPGRISRYFDEFAVEQLKTYFNSGTFAGGQFERFAGGGDRPETANQFTCDDVVAVSFLGENLPGLAAIQLLEDEYGEIGDLLSQIPVGVDLWEVPQEAIGPDSPAGQLERLLGDLPGISPFGPGKLLARKRPRLIPAYEKAVRNSLERSDEDGWWLPLHDVLASRPPLVRAIADLREQTELGEDISFLRIIYVVIWMRANGRPDFAPDASAIPARTPRRTLPISATATAAEEGTGSALTAPRGRSRSTRFTSPPRP
jgi:uncharacterized protein DUF6308